MFEVITNIEVKSRRSSKQTQEELSTPEGRRPRRSCTLAQSATVVAEEPRKTRDRKTSRQRSASPAAEQESPATRVKSVRRSTSRVNYQEESEGEDGTSAGKKEADEEDYSVEDDDYESDTQVEVKTRTRSRKTSRTLAKKQNIGRGRRAESKKGQGEQFVEPEKNENIPIKEGYQHLPICGKEESYETPSRRKTRAMRQTTRASKGSTPQGRTLRVRQRGRTKTDDGDEESEVTADMHMECKVEIGSIEENMKLKLDETSEDELSAQQSQKKAKHEHSLAESVVEMEGINEEKVEMNKATSEMEYEEAVEEKASAGKPLEEKDLKNPVSSASPQSDKMDIDSSSDKMHLVKNKIIEEKLDTIPCKLQAEVTEDVKLTKVNPVFFHDGSKELKDKEVEQFYQDVFLKDQHEKNESITDACVIKFLPENENKITSEKDFLETKEKVKITDLKDLDKINLPPYQKDTSGVGTSQLSVSTTACRENLRTEGHFVEQNDAVLKDDQETSSSKDQAVVESFGVGRNNKSVSLEEPFVQRKKEQITVVMGSSEVSKVESKANSDTEVKEAFTSPTINGSLETSAFDVKQKLSEPLGSYIPERDESEKKESSHPESMKVTSQSESWQTDECCSPFSLSRKVIFNSSLNPELRTALQERTFTIVSYNVELRGDNNQTYTDELTQGLKAMHPDVICLQNVSFVYFREVLEPSLGALGFKGVVCVPGSEKTGLATFCRLGAFQISNHSGVSLLRAIEKDLDNSFLSLEEKNGIRNFLTDCGHVLLTRITSPSDRSVTVGNVSLPSTNNSSQTLQVCSLIREVFLTRELASYSYVLCGQFHMKENSLGYQLLKNGRLTNDLKEELKSYKELNLPGKENIALVNVLSNSFQCPGFSLQSCYQVVKGQEPVSQNCASMLWCSSENLQPVSVVDLPENTTSNTVPLKVDIAFID
ncbi:uncharacterized protein LOC143258404 isoform X2 [Tachypleus tridentatus]|uniref:uncharacterized protein LOC143258404 isoform X2 n=1 Tax=Tachypleus tridentatus TaxID=6853 RepID=UPI003FD5EFC9